MCQVFAHTDPILYESRTHSVRIRGVITNVRLENLFWQILADMAETEKLTTNQLLARLHDEVHQFRGDFKNFASFLRVTCLRFQTLRLQPATDTRDDVAPRRASSSTVMAEKLKVAH